MHFTVVKIGLGRKQIDFPTARDVNHVEGSPILNGLTDLVRLRIPFLAQSRRQTFGLDHADAHD